MPIIDTNGALHDTQGRFAEHSATSAGYDLSVDQAIRNLGAPDTCGGCGTPTPEMTGPPTADSVWRLLCPECRRDLEGDPLSKMHGVEGEFDGFGRWTGHADILSLASSSCSECGADLLADEEMLCSQCAEIAGTTP